MEEGKPPNGTHPRPSIRNQGQRNLRRNRAAIVGAVFLIFLFLFCFVGPIVTTHNQPDQIHVTDVILSVPLYLLLFVLSASFTDGSARSVILLIAFFGWQYAARLVRGEFLSLREREYVLAARTIGARGFRTMFRHILPNAAGPIIVNATLLIGVNIILESVMSYFGFGI